MRGEARVALLLATKSLVFVIMTRDETTTGTYRSKDYDHSMIATKKNRSTSEWQMWALGVMTGALVTGILASLMVQQLVQHLSQLK